MANDASQFPDLEASLEEISNLIEKMEKDELSLDQSLSYFERGIGLVKHCQKILTEAEQKVQILVQNQNQEAALVNYCEENKNLGLNEKITDDVVG